MKKIYLIAIFSFFCATNIFCQYNWMAYPYTPQNSVVSFPLDDGKHTDLNTLTEWWYINLHLIGSAPAFKQYDVMLCYFSKPATMRIFNIADPVSGVFHTDVNKTPFVFSQQAGHWELTYNIPFLISDNSNWTYPTSNTTFSYTYHAEEPVNNDALDVTVTGNRPPLIVGGDGFIPLGGEGDSSFYYSYSNMKVEGSITFGGTVDNISSGIAWIDRQWGPFTVGINTSNMYEWFSLQMDNPGVTWGIPQSPSEFNIWQIYSDTNNVPYQQAYRLVSGIYPDNSQDTTSDFIFERTGYWHDPVNNKYYSQGWRLINPVQGMNIDITASIQNQVIDVTLFKFWEGGTILKGTVGNQPVEGLGFAELVAGHNSEIVVPSAPTGFTVTTASDHYSLSWAASAPGSYPIGGYRIYKSSTTDGYWKYVATTSGLSYNDFSGSVDSGCYYTVSSFDDQTATSASAYAVPVWANPSGVYVNSPDSKSIRIYPNPANDKTCIELPGYKNAAVEILSMDGRLLQNFTLRYAKTIINTDGFERGVYLLKIYTEKEVFSEKMIVE
ncbi:MAG: T9SS type A sorting domain-containing protein [Bacteroidia bacterium]|nr:T9SS type A sorting domain-containing protein [Bacteroidia bacterium]